jgi:hypothetical protein
MLSPTAKKTGAVLLILPLILSNARMQRLLRSGHGCGASNASSSGASTNDIVKPQRRTTTKRPMDGVSDDEPASKLFKADGRVSEGNSLFITVFITLSTSLVFSFIHIYFKI